VLDGESEVEQQGLRVVAADDLHPDREAVDAAHRIEIAGLPVGCWPGWSAHHCSRWPGQSHTRAIRSTPPTVVLMGPAAAKATSGLEAQMMTSTRSNSSAIATMAFRR